MSLNKTDDNFEEEQEEYSTTGIEETEESPPKIQFPFDPNSILFSTQQQSLQLLLEKVEYEEIILNPDWQRMANIWKFDKKCRLIESLLLRIPIPAFYMYIKDENNVEIWSVIDGLQRLSILHHFVNGINNQAIDTNELESMKKNKEVVIKGNKNFLVLKDLQYLSLKSIADEKKVPPERKLKDKDDYEYILYEELESSYQRIIKSTQVTVFGIRLKTIAKDKETREQQQQVIYNIFERINTGGLPLSPQEIRHAIKQGKSTQLLKELADSKQFKEATNGKIKPHRMEDRELVLRYLFFKIKGYRDEKSFSQKDFNFLLMTLMDEINKEKDDSKIKQYKDEFLNSMERAKKVFGEFAFRRIRKDKKGKNRPSLINKPLFEAVSVNLSLLDETEIQKLVENQKELQKGYIQLFHSNEVKEGITFADSISRSTTDYRSIKRRFEAIAELLKRYSR
ncbi:MAG: DUF262 domain-containing protein [Leptospiraceae bacterium]|nr:DUF262 domain-containing protein [Leptospiraceae bacterium]